MSEAQEWARHTVRPRPVVTIGLWSLLLGCVAVTSWSLVFHRDLSSCAGRYCQVATLSGHPLLVLVLAVTSSSALAVTAVVTHGFTQGSPVSLGVTGAAAATGVTAVAGPALVVALFTALVAVVLGAIALLVAFFVFR